MKFTLDIEDPLIEQYDYEGRVIGEEEFSVKGFLFSEAKKALYAKFKTSNIEKMINTKISQKLDGLVIDGIINEIEKLSDRFMGEYLDRKIVESDRWGKEKYSGTLRDKIHQAFDVFMGGTVDKGGRPSSSSHNTLYKRSEYMINCLLDKKMNEFTKSTISEVREAIEVKLTKELKFAIGKGVVDSIGIPKLLENIKGTQK